MRDSYELMKVNEIICIKYLERASLVAQSLKRLPPMRETQWLDTEKAVNYSVERNTRRSRQFWSLACSEPALSLKGLKYLHLVWFPQHPNLGSPCTRKVGVALMIDMHQVLLLQDLVAFQCQRDVTSEQTLSCTHFPELTLQMRP